MAGSNPEDRVVATAHHILRTLSSSHTDDMMRILSNFDDRFSRLSLSMPRSSVPDPVPTPPSDLSSQNCRYQQVAPLPDEEDDDMESRHGDGACDDEDRLPPSLKEAEEAIMRWDYSSESTRQIFLWSDKREEVSGYLVAVDSLHSLIDSLCSSSSEASHVLDHAQNAIQFAMLRLEAEFCHLLQLHSEPADPTIMFNLVSSRSSFNGGFSFSSSNSSRRVEEEPENVSDCLHNDDDPVGGDNEEEEEGIAKSRSLSDMTIEFLPPNIVTDLFDIASRMLKSGYDTECIQAYVSIRKTIIEDSLQRLGQEKFTFEEVQKMAWEQLENEISKWIQAMKITIQCLFPSEKQLCEKIFEGWPDISDSCFADVAKSSLMQLLNFGEAIAIGRRAPEKLFKILDMYECLSESIPPIESMFSAESSAGLRSEASAILSRLGDAARGTFAEFENAIQRDSSKNPVPGGAVHPLARYVMNYMKFLSDYSDTMNMLLADRKDVQNANFSQRDSDKGPLSIVTIGIMENLEKSLDAKSKLYKDQALANLFLMNNAHYISQKVKDSDVRKLLGNEWLKRNTGKLRQYHYSYRRTAWNRVLSCLRDEGINISGGSASGASRNILKERFKNFNAAFEENVKTQSGWIVPDSQLCTELRISITEMILPAYRSFLGRFQNHLDSVRHPEKYVKYTPEDLETYLNDLFEGSSGSMNKRKSFPASGSGQ